MPTVHLLDYVAGNIRSLVNAVEKVGYTVKWIEKPEDVIEAEVNLNLSFSLTKYLGGSATETDLAWSGPFWSLSAAICGWRLLRANTQVHTVRQAFYGNMCWLASSL